MSFKKEKIRVLLTKSDLDIHDIGIRQVLIGLREAGMEVILTRYRSPEEIANVALQEDVDVIGISFMDGVQMYVTSELMRLLKENGLDRILVILGGVIPDDEMSELEKLGVAKTFRPGTYISDIVNYITSHQRS